MGAAHRARERHQATPRTQPNGNRIAKDADTLQGHRCQAAHPGLRDAVANTMHREDGTLRAPVLNPLVLRRRHLLESIGELDFADNRHTIPHRKLPRDPRLFEKRDLKDARGIDEEHLRHDHTALGSGAVGDGIHGAHNRGDLTDRCHLNGQCMSEIEIPERNM